MMTGPKVVMTPGTYARKTAYHIDPLLAASVVIEEPHNPRINGEIHADEFWKQRNHDKKGRPFWKPLGLVAILFSVLAISNLSGTTNAESRASDVKIADVSFHVQQVQYVLRSYGYSIKVDGIFGAQTERAVKHFQKVNGLIVDGIVGNQTLTAMNLTLGSPASTTTPAVRTSPPSAPTYNGGAAGADQWYDLAMQVGWTDAQWPVLRCIISRESRGIASAKNPNSSATGLLQILARYYPGVNLYDPETNLRTGLALYQTRGWQPWVYAPKPCY